MLTSEQVSQMVAADAQRRQAIMGAYVPESGQSVYPPQFRYDWGGGWQSRAAEAAPRYAMAPLGNVGHAMSTVSNMAGLALGGAWLGNKLGIDSIGRYAGSRTLSMLSELDPTAAFIGGALTGGVQGFAAGGLGGIARGALGGGITALSNPVTLASAAVTAGAEQVWRGFQEQRQVSKSLAQYQFTNATSFTGRGFSTTDQMTIGNAVRNFDASDAYTSFKDAFQVMNRFNEFGMGQGVRDAEEFGKRFRAMAETVKTMAQTLGTTIEEASSTFAQYRRAGLYTARDVVGATFQMRAIESAGMRRGDYFAMQEAGAGLSRSMGMTGSVGAKATSGMAENLLTSVGMGHITAEQLMDITGAQDLSSAASAFSLDTTGKLAGFLTNSAAGKALLAAIGQQDASGRFTGDVDGSRLQEVLLGETGIGDLSGKAREKLKSSNSRLSFTNKNIDIAGSLLEQDPMAVTSVLIDSLRKERPGLNEEDLFTYAMEQIVGLDRKQAKLFQKEFETYQQTRQEKARLRLQEVQTAFFQTEMAKNHTLQGVVTKVTGTVDDTVGMYGRQIGASVGAAITHGVEAAADDLYGRVRYNSDDFLRRSALGSETAGAGTGSRTANGDFSATGRAVMGDFSGIEAKYDDVWKAEARALGEEIRANDRMRRKAAQEGERSLGHFGFFQPGDMFSESDAEKYAMALHYAGYDSAAAKVAAEASGASGSAENLSATREGAIGAIEKQIRSNYKNYGSGRKNITEEIRVNSQFDRGESMFDDLSQTGGLGVLVAMQEKGLTAHGLRDLMQRNKDPSRSAAELSKLLGGEVSEEAVLSATRFLESTRGAGQEEMLKSVTAAATNMQSGVDYTNLAVALASDAGMADVNNSEDYEKLLSAAQAAGSGVKTDVRGALDTYLSNLDEDSITSLSKSGPMGETLAKAAMQRKAVMRATTAEDLASAGVTDEMLSSWGLTAETALSDKEGLARRVEMDQVMRPSQGRGGLLMEGMESELLLQVSKQLAATADANRRLGEEVTFLAAQRLTPKGQVSGGTVTPEPGAGAKPEQGPK